MKYDQALISWRPGDIRHQRRGSSCIGGGQMRKSEQPPEPCLIMEAYREAGPISPAGGVVNHQLVKSECATNSECLAAEGSNLQHTGSDIRRILLAATITTDPSLLPPPPPASHLPVTHTVAPPLCFPSKPSGGEARSADSRPVVCQLCLCARSRASCCLKSFSCFVTWRTDINM